MPPVDLTSILSPSTRLLWAQPLLLWSVVHFANPMPSSKTTKRAFASSLAFGIVMSLIVHELHWVVIFSVLSLLMKLPNCKILGHLIPLEDLRWGVRLGGHLFVFCVIPLLVTFDQLSLRAPILVLPTNSGALAGSLFTLAGFCFILGGGSTVVSVVLGAKPETKNDPAEEEADELGSDGAAKRRAGWKIGVLERILVYVFVLAGQYGALGLLIAAKGIVRSKAMEADSDFAEYVLVGTLSSMTVALSTGWIVGAFST